MRAAVLVFVVVMGLVVWALVAQRNQGSAYGQQSGDPLVGKVNSSSGLLVLSSDATDGHQQLVLVDPKSQVMSVYHVDRSSGEISLKSVRNVRWDLLMDEFNGNSPSPREIRALVEQR